MKRGARVPAGAPATLLVLLPRALCFCPSCPVSRQAANPPKLHTAAATRSTLAHASLTNAARPPVPALPPPPQAFDNEFTKVDQGVLFELILVRTPP